jgi:hypothetical protein
MPGSPRPPERIHLVRLEARRVCGWQLRVPSWHPQGPYTRYFADSHYGGSEGALKAARKIRNKVFAEAGLPLRQRGQRPPGGVGEKNHSGLTGVFLQRDHRPGRRHYAYWVAIWSLGLKPYKKSFAVSQWGYEGAFWQAVELRQRMTGMLFTNEELGEALRKNRYWG